ncbi:MAG TPA: hypothetical protein VLK22_04435 [Candidatus Udaeobacter sp.]|nr:hypothetical protein [Candidatus Udaeobacter sp.]
MQKFNKFALKILLLIFTFVTIAGSLSFVQPAQAIPVEVVADAPSTMDKVLDQIALFLKTATVNIAVQSFAYFMRRVSYDSAVWLASGGKGETPFAHTKTFGNYISDVADNAAGVAIEQLGKPYGLNLCKIPDPKIDLAMRIGLNYQFLSQTVVKPTCTWQSFQKDVLNADNWKSQFGSVDDVAKKFNVAFSVDQSDIGILLSATEKIDNIVAQQTTAETLQRQEGQGVKDKKTLISDNISTNGNLIAHDIQSLTPSEQQKKAEQGFWSTVGTGLTGAISGAGSLFLNTLLNKMVENYRNKGMFPFGACIGDSGDPSCKGVQNNLLNAEGQISQGGRQGAQALFADFLTPPNVQIDRYDILGSFSSCPPTSPGPENCVVDSGLAQAAQETSVGKPITIADALAKNWLHGEWKLLSPERSADQTDVNCYQRAYCYANIAKLRKSRILPLGFEIAALNSNPDTPWTLKQVVDGFNDCNFIKDANGNVVGVDNDPINKPFCHLIDPNWVVKAPALKCNFLAFGATPFFRGTPNRAQECADLSTCVAYDKNGNCSNQGYCTRERNVWKIDAAKCDSQFRTCQSFQDSTGKDVSYLYRTLDTAYCNQDNVGCAEYSLKQDNNGSWTNYAKNDLNSAGENSAIYLNNKISTNCSANSDGCASFQVASTSDKLYLRQAPYYLQCYDTNPSTLAIDWPQTNSDLAKLPTKSACNNFSQACIPDEVNCNSYNPVSYVGTAIPGKFTPATVVENQIVWNDQCDKRCVGYSAYREIPSNYSDGQAVSYIIPSSGSKCSAIDEGCTSFTNLSATVGGLEKVEHFSYLRPCILPDTTKQKNFYTYEGSAVGGYQLKGFVLEKNSDGSPKYFYRTNEDLVGYDSVCSESLYKQGLASPDCRQFNDDKGAVYYKLLSKTIAVSQSCTPYRLNDTELRPVNLSQADCLTQKGNWDSAAGKCSVCFQNGEYRDGQCFYSGLPGDVQNTAGISKTCAAEVNSCRAYKGNAGNNVKNIFNNNFEETPAAMALKDWGPAANISVSLESTHAGEHSLSYNGTAAVYKNLSLTPSKSYDITFWAKGSVGAKATVILQNDSVVTLGDASVGDVWQFYHFGPVELGGTATSTQLKFSINGQLFIDNVSLKEVTDYTYLVKNTLKVNPVCDSNLDDNLPGEALGCSAYKTPDDKPAYLTKFTSLCREKAIGCTALYDTRKTPDEPGPRAYNVWFSGEGGTSVAKTIGGQNYSCQVPVGQIGCYVNTVGATLSTITAAGGEVVTSTIYVQPDTPLSSPIYLVANQEATCNAVDLGCVSAGRLVQTPTGATYENILIKNDPALYDTTLCQKEAVGCNTYTSANGALYFKDPATIGQKICAYRENVFLNGSNYSGWFWKNVGKCSASGNLCTTDKDCGSSGGTCAGLDEQPCYPNYLQTGNNYGLWSYGVTSSYNNFVGECPSTQSGCTEFIDHNDNNKVYDLINDDRMKALQSGCNGQISEKSGCILFDKTDLPNKLWNTAQSYANSVKLNNSLVGPVASNSGDPNDANIILKVDRDRECGEWLQCRSSHRVFDSQTGNYKEICDAIGRCNKSPESAEKGDITNCANWVSSQELVNQVLTDDAYRNRNTDWTGQEFSGYSILNYYPVEELSEVNFGGNSATDQQWRLAKKVPCGGGSNCASSVFTEDFACNTTGLACGRGNAGICQNHICLSNPNGTTADVTHQSIGQSCRAYPEETSPFPNSEPIGNSSVYGSVNLCNETAGFITDKTKAAACDCNYTKINYGDSFTKYWDFNNPNSNGILKPDGTLAKGIVSGICSGGVSAGLVCGTDSDCTGGSCQKLGKQARLIGWHGYCIEPDISRPLNAEPNNFACLTWFPVDTIMGSPDINSQHVEAGFQASSAGGKYYCLDAQGNQQFDSAAQQNNYDKLLGTKTIARPGSVNNSCTDTSGPCSSCVSNGCFTNPFTREKRVIGNLSSQNIFLDGIDYIKIVTKSGDNNWLGNRTFYIRNGLKTKYNGPQWSVVGKEAPPAQQLKGESLNLGFGPYAASDGTDQSKNAEWFLRYDDGEGDGTDNWQFGDPAQQDITAAGFTDLLISNNSVPPPVPVNGGSNCSVTGGVVGNLDAEGRDNIQLCVGDHDDHDDGCAVRVKFNNGKLDRVNLVCYTDDNGDTESATADVYVGLRETCTRIAQTEAVPYSSVGWTDHLWKNTNYIVSQPDLPYLIFIPNILNYPFSLLNEPFGSLAVNSLAPNKLINIFTHYNKTTFDPPPAITGFPYGCDGVCADLRSANPEGTPGPASNQGIVEGKLFLSTIFAKIDSVWSWNQSVGGYEQDSNWEDTFNPNPTNRPYNFTAETNWTSQGRAPKIHSLGTCKKGDKCLETNTDGFTLNGKSSGDVVFPDRVAPVNIKFFGFADKNQMPIKKMQVDWGDGDKVSLDGYFRNKRGEVNGVCGTNNTCFVSSSAGDINTKQSCASNNDCRYLDNCFAENISPNFGQIAGRTCDSAYFRFDHVYQCLRGGSGWTSSCPDAQTQSLSGGCCVFKPKVQIKDNWGWCNGTCVGGPGGNGCYDKSWLPGNQDECQTSGAYTTFNGKVIVAPE